MVGHSVTGGRRKGKNRGVAQLTDGRNGGGWEAANKRLDLLKGTNEGKSPHPLGRCQRTGEAETRLSRQAHVSICGCTVSNGRSEHMLALQARQVWQWPVAAILVLAPLFGWA
jgi:hypothetical protein